MIRNRYINKAGAILLTFSFLLGMIITLPLGNTVVSTYYVTRVSIDRLWQELDNDTITLINESRNVSIGQNATTTYKLFVNGTLKINETSIFHNSEPETNITYNLGSNLLHWNNVFAKTYYGDGSQLTGISGVADGYAGGKGHPHNQDLNTTDNATFDWLDVTNDVNVTGNVLISTSPTPNPILTVSGGDIWLGGSVNPEYVMYSTQDGAHNWSFYGARDAFSIRDRDTATNVFQIWNDSFANSIQIKSTIIGINVGMNDLDFLVRGDNNGELLRCDASTDRVGIGTSTPDQIFDVRGNVNITGKINITGDMDISGNTIMGDGGTTNYVEIDDSGVMTLNGDARIKQNIGIPGILWEPADEIPAATRDEVGIFGTMKLSTNSHNDNESALYVFTVPKSFEEGSEITVIVDWCYTGSDAPGYVCWNLSYRNVASGETIDSTVSYINATTEGSHNSGELIRTTFTGNIVGAEVNDNIGLKLTRASTEDTLNPDVHLIQVHFQFTEDKLGEAI